MFKFIITEPEPKPQVGPSSALESFRTETVCSRFEKKLNQLSMSQAGQAQGKSMLLI